MIHKKTRNKSVILNKISLLNFKNYDQIEVETSPFVNCFLGKNGMGKTNILDGIYYLSNCKSFFNSVDSQNIKNEEDFFVIQGEFEGEDNTIQIDTVTSTYVNKNKPFAFGMNAKGLSNFSCSIVLYLLI